MDETGKRLLSARLDDLYAESDRGYVTFSTFLDPSEVFFAKDYIRRIGAQERAFFFGGYNNSERCCVFFLPEYFETFTEDKSQFNELFPMLQGEISAAIRMIKISGSGYRNLSHRDYMGAILNLGIDRSALGDICVLDEKSAVLFAAPAVADLIVTSCERIGSDKVKIEELPVSDDFCFERKTKDISDTIASDRVDCVVASLSSSSREKAKSIILSGLVECNYSICERTDLRLKNNDIVSIRGIGKFVISDITEETKKGRIRLSAKKYI